jgi:integrase
MLANYLRNHSIANVDVNTLVEFYHHLYQSGYAAGTAIIINTAISDYLRTAGIADISKNRTVENTLKGYAKLDAPTRAKFQREAFTLEGFNSLLSYAHNKGHPEYCILFSLGFFFLLRVSEALGARVEHFHTCTHTSKTTLTVIKGKTGWYQNVTVHRKYLSGDITNWIHGSTYNMSNLTAKKANAIIHDWMGCNSLPSLSLSFHSLRHAGAFYYANLGMTQDEIKNIGRWKSTNTARHYYRKTSSKQG